MLALVHKIQYKKKVSVKIYLKFHTLWDCIVSVSDNLINVICICQKLWNYKYTNLYTNMYLHLNHPSRKAEFSQKYFVNEIAQNFKTIKNFETGLRYYNFSAHFPVCVYICANKQMSYNTMNYRDSDVANPTMPGGSTT